MFQTKVVFNYDIESFINIVVMWVFVLFIFFITMWMGGILVGSGGYTSDAYYSKVKPTVIISGSMEPTIAVNSVILLENIDYSELELGDIIMFNTLEYGLVAHRIVEEVDSGFITKGDNNEERDNWVVTEGVYKGKVTEIYNLIAPIITFLFGDLTNIVMSKIIFGYTMVTIFCSVCFMFSVKIVKKITYMLIKLCKLERGGIHGKEKSE